MVSVLLLWDNEVCFDSLSETGTWLDWHLTVYAGLTVLTVVVYLTDSDLAKLREKGRELTDRDVSLSVGICCELLGVRRLVGIRCVS